MATLALVDGVKSVVGQPKHPEASAWERAGPDAAGDGEAGVEQDPVPDEHGASPPQARAVAAATAMIRETAIRGRITWVSPPSVAGRWYHDYKGRDAVFAQFGRYGGETAGSFKATLQRVFTTEDGRVIGVHQNTATRNGEHLDVSCCLVFELKDGRVTDGREYIYDLHAWEEFWS